MSSLLLDSNALIAYAANSKRIGPKARALLNRSELYFSSLSIAELRLKELRVPGFRLGLTTKFLNSIGIEEVQFSSRDLDGLVTLETKDPFDLLLAAQANSRGLGLVTSDLEILASDLAFAVDLTA
ncbi:MAG: hypothetical protein RL418_523 [Actinomycetota bacterium]|jgi:PIN domain nuclease of toxin-antitoxin system